MIHIRYSGLGYCLIPFVHLTERLYTPHTIYAASLRASTGTGANALPKGLHKMEGRGVAYFGRRSSIGLNVFLY